MKLNAAIAPNKVIDHLYMDSLELMSTQIKRPIYTCHAKK